MSAAARHGARSVAARVALVTTAIVAAVYVVVAVVVVVIVSSNLTGDIDRRLAASLTRLATTPTRFPAGGFREPPGGPRFGPPLLVWTIHPDGAVTGNDTTAVLPSEDHTVAAPRTVSVGDTDVRIAGGTVGDDRVVVGQTMDSVAQARANVVRAELVVGPLLLIAVFLGALTIGRRVAAPLELARRRQMEFTADASHELRTPLSVIEAQTSLALSQERDAAWYRRAFERVEAESGRIRRLVEDMLWLARFDAAAHPHAEQVDLGVLAGQAVARFATVAETRRLALSLRVHGEAPVVVAPPEWLDRLLGVLLDNACKYSPESGRVDVTVSEAGGRVRLAVEDSGPGIPTEERSRIFDRFHRATERPGGAGLGLAIANAIVSAGDGHWELGTSPAGGASMAVWWPRAYRGNLSVATDSPADLDRGGASL